MDNFSIQVFSNIGTAVLMLLLYIAFTLKVPKRTEGWPEKRLKQCPTCKRWQDA